jgi:hypothetical protein
LDKRRGVKKVVLVKCKKKDEEEDIRGRRISVGEKDIRDEGEFSSNRGLPRLADWHNCPTMPDARGGS